MLRTLTCLTLTASLLAVKVNRLEAQTFVAPNAAEYTFGDPHVGAALNTSCYSLRAGYAYFPDMISATGTAYTDLYVAGWNNKDIGGTHEVTVLLTAVGDPTNLLWKTSIPYSNVRDLEVGSIRNTSTNNTNILVAYYQEGVGHKLDIYELTPAPGTPYQLVDHKDLSNSPTYGRIRMDFHATYQCAISWVNTLPGATKGIQAMVYTNNTWSGITTLSGTANKTGVDIAINRVSEPINFSTIAYPLHFVYSGGGFITESTVSMNTLAAVPAMTTATVAPAINDNFYAGAGLNSRLVLDCADFSVSATVPNSSSWAYTYSDGINVIVRHRNATMPAANTVIVTSGMLGNSPLDPVGGVYTVYSPALNYGIGDPSAGTDQIMVTWYASDGASDNSYMALQMDPNGTTVTSTMDYLQLPNASTATMPAGFTSGIALSKTGPKSVGDYLYATYYDVDATTGDYQLHHAFHKWGDVVFKGEGTTGISVGAAPEAATVSVYPNPFRDILNASVSLPENGRLQLTVYDMAGRQVWTYDATLNKGKHMVSAEGTRKLASGFYMLTTSLNGKKINTKMITKK